MQITRTLGRAADNDIRFEQSDIGRHHARITQLNANEFLVEDLDSLCGTFVNGYRVHKATVSINDEVRLSESGMVDLKKIFNLALPGAESPKKDPKDFASAFDLLKPVWENYQKQRIAILKRHQTRTTYIRAAITLSPLLVWEILQVGFPAFSERFQKNYLVFSVLGSTLGVIATGTSSPVEKLTQLDEEFRVKYVCPNQACKSQLGNVPWQSYKNQGKCFRCGAKYN